MWTALDKEGRIIKWWFRPDRNNLTLTKVIIIHRLDPPATEEEKQKIKREVLQ